MINIVDDINLYPAVMGIEWAIDNHTIINFKKWILTFEDAELGVVAPIDPLEGQRYVKKVNSEGGYTDNIYNINPSMDDYVNSIFDGKLIWLNISSCTSN